MSRTAEEGVSRERLRGGGSATPGVSRSAFLRASIGPIVVALMSIVLAPVLAGDASAAARVRSGAVIGAGAGWLTAFLVGLWTMRACARGGSAFLLPMTGGFLVKLLVLAGGTLLMAGPLRSAGLYVAYALCFAASAFVFHLMIMPSVRRAPGAAEAIERA